MPFKRRPYVPKYPPSFTTTASGFRRFDVGIDWNRAMSEEAVTRMLAAPYLEEASALLCGAAAVWSGRYGTGRVAAGEMVAQAAEWRQVAQAWIRAGLGWTDSSLHRREGSDGREVGGHLASLADRRSFFIENHDDLKDPEAARRLVEAASELVIEAVPLVRETGRRLHADQTADGLEDQLEKLGYRPWAEPPQEPLTTEAYDFLKRRAFLRTCAGLCLIPARLCPKIGTDGVHTWWDCVEWYQQESIGAYADFVASAPEAEQPVLLAARDNASPYSEGQAPTWLGQESHERVVTITKCLVAALTRWADGQFEQLALPAVTEK